MATPVYRKTWSATLLDLDTMFDRWGIETWDVEEVRVYQSVRRRRDLTAEERAVTVTWTDKGGIPRELACDRFETRDANLRAIYLTLDSIRLNEVRGVGELARRAYLQLAAGDGDGTPHATLGLEAGASREEIERAYRGLAREHHPDAGGDADRFKAITRARDALLGRERPMADSDLDLSARLARAADLLWQQERSFRSLLDLIGDWIEAEAEGEAEAERAADAIRDRWRRLSPEHPTPLEWPEPGTIRILPGEAEGQAIVRCPECGWSVVLVLPIPVEELGTFAETIRLGHKCATKRGAKGEARDA